MQHKALSYGWNACINDYRTMDLLNNKEASMLRFEELSGLNKQQQQDLAELELPANLPARCFVAGVLKEVVEAGKFSPHHSWVMSLSWGWALWVLRQSGLINQQQVSKRRGLPFRGLLIKCLGFRVVPVIDLGGGGLMGAEAKWADQPAAGEQKEGVTV